MHFLLFFFKSSRYQSKKVVNNQTSQNALVEKPQNESGGIQNKYGSRGTAQSWIRESALIEKSDCIHKYISNFF